MKNVSASNDNSPMKAQEKSLNKSKTNNGDKNELMDMIKECSKNIEKIEFRQSNSKANSHSILPAFSFDKEKDPRKYE